ncbi:MAG: SMP-30/gluconolactonase/LRE family protein [Pirellulales bacterium]
MSRYSPFMQCAVLAVAVASTCAWSFGGEFEPIAQDEIVPLESRVELLWDEGEFTEGPAPAADGAILFSDIGNRIMRYEPATGSVTVFREPSGRANGMMFDAEGRLVVCEGANTGGGRRLSITDADGQVRTLVDRWQGKRLNSPNDLAISPAGRVYFSDPRYVGDEPREIDFDGLFVVEPGGDVSVATEELTMPNGVVVSPDGSKVYVADHDSAPTGNRHLVVFDVAEDGTLTNKRVLFDFGAGNRGIDGMTVDRLGNVYATAGSGERAGVYVFAPDGRQLAMIPVPGTPTNCVFGIGEDAATLYITAMAPSDATSGATKTGAAKGDIAKEAFALYRIKLRYPGFHVFEP